VCRADGAEGKSSPGERHVLVTVLLESGLLESEIRAIQWLMPTFYKIDKERKLVMTTYSGVLTIAEALGHQEKLPKDPDFDPSFSQLFDVTHVTDVQLTAEDVRLLARATVFSPDSRRAILVDSDLKFGLARMFEELRDTMGEKGIRVFRNLDEALDWIFAKDHAV
jgi:hypothetical protein